MWLYFRFSSERAKLNCVTHSVKFEYWYLKKLSMIRNKVVWDKHCNFNRLTVRNIFLFCYSRFRLMCIFKKKLLRNFEFYFNGHFLLLENGVHPLAPLWSLYHCLSSSIVFGSSCPFVSGRYRQSKQTMTHIEARITPGPYGTYIAWKERNLKETFVIATYFQIKWTFKMGFFKFSKSQKNFQKVSITCGPKKRVD